MRVVNRDIEIMGWILEQKFMTVDQVIDVFWIGTESGRKEGYRRLLELQREGCLKRCKSGIYRNLMYLVTASGLKVLRVSGRDRGLSENVDLDYASYKHDVVVTDIRIMFHKWGYRDWASERIVAKHNNLRRVPDGVIYQGDKCFAIEYESTQKSKKRYEDIFLEYELERQIDKVIYVVDTLALFKKLCTMAGSYKKPRFVQFQHLQEKQLNCLLVGVKEQIPLRDLLNTGVQL